VGSLPKMPGTDVVSENVHNLSSLDPAVRLKAVRNVKNSVIGSKFKKDLYTNYGAVPKLAELLLGEDDEELIVQAVTAIGSFACGSEQSCRAVTDGGALSPLARTLFHPSIRVIEAGVRTLSTVFQSEMVPKDFVLKEGTLPRVVALLSFGHPKVTEVSCSIIAKCCVGREHQEAVNAAGAVPVLIALVTDPRTPAPTRDAALDVVVALSSRNRELATTLASGPGLAQVLMDLMKDLRPTSRMRACRALTQLGHWREGPLGSPGVRMATLSTLVKLLALQEPVREEVPEVLGDLIEFDEGLQAAGCDLGVVPLLASLLLAPWATSSLQAACLSALAAVASRREDARRAVLDAKVLPQVAASLSHPSEVVRAAACRCARSLSRSVKSLRTALVDGGLALPLLRLMGDSDTALEATATVCNLVLDFSPMKKVIIDNDGVSAIVALTNSMDEALRLNALWALKNLLYDADLDLKAAVMRRLTFDSLYRLIQDGDMGTKEQAVNIVRNLSHGRPAHVELVMAGMGRERLFASLASCLQPGMSEGVMLQAIYTAVNLATGAPAQKESVMYLPLLHRALVCIGEASCPLRVGALWLFVNLSYDDDPCEADRVHLYARVRQLRAMGVEAALLAASPPDRESRDQIKTILAAFVNVPA